MNSTDVAPIASYVTNKLFDWGWIRRTIDRNFDKLLLVSLIGLSIGLAILGDIAVMRGKAGFDLVSRSWLREQTALLVGALLGLMRGDHASDDPGRERGGK